MIKGAKRVGTGLATMGLVGYLCINKGFINLFISILEINFLIPLVSSLTAIAIYVAKQFTKGKDLDFKVIFTIGGVSLALAGFALFLRSLPSYLDISHALFTLSFVSCLPLFWDSDLVLFSGNSNGDPVPSSSRPGSPTGNTGSNSPTSSTGSNPTTGPSNSTYPNIPGENSFDIKTFVGLCNHINLLYMREITSGLPSPKDNYTIGTFIDTKFHGRGLTLTELIAITSLCPKLGINDLPTFRDQVVVNKVSLENTSLQSRLTPLGKAMFECSTKEGINKWYK